MERNEEEVKREQMVLRFRAFSVSLVASAFLVLSMVTSWAHTALMKDGVITDWWNYSLRGINSMGAFLPYSDSGFYIMSFVLILLVGLLGLSAILTISIYTKGWPLKERYFSRASLLCIALSGTALFILSTVAPARIMEYAFIWHQSSDETTTAVGGTNTITLSGTPGIAWFTLVLFIACQVILLTTMKNMDLDHSNEESTAAENGDENNREDQ